MRNRLLLTVALVMVLFGSLVTSHILNTLFNPLPIEDTLTFQVEKGSSLYGVLLELKNEGLIKDVQIARLYARFSELEQIRAGEFLLEPGMSLSDVIQRFNSNDVIFPCYNLRVSDITNSIIRGNYNHDCPAQSHSCNAFEIEVICYFF